MSTLWDKGYDIDQTLLDFTVGRDHLLDAPLVPADCVGTLAHVSALQRARVLTSTELEQVRSGINTLLDTVEAGRFEIRKEQEDGHTALEQALEAEIGQVARKVHTARSRNDQVLTSTRLYLRDFLLELAAATAELISTLLRRAEQHRHVPMPGRTHTQKAMLSSIGLWAGSYADTLLDELTLLESTYALLNRSPLGSAAGYGVPLAIDRHWEAELLGFDRPQRNVLAASNSRGRIESYLIDVVEQLSITLSKLAQDMVLFSLPELGYLTLPDSLCTGSSIMPQKKNPDGLEVARATAGTISGYASQLKNIVRSLPSGYNRDYQLTKEPTMRAAEAGLRLVRIMTVSASEFGVDENALRAACAPELFATDEALTRVGQGVPFRDAYKEVASDLGRLRERSNDLDAGLAARGSYGNTGDLRLDEAQAELDEARGRFRERHEAVDGAVTALCGRRVALFRWLPR